MATGIVLVLLVVTVAVGMFLGLLICSHVGIGFGFTDLRKDILKCVLVSIVTVAAGAGLLTLAGSLRVLLPLPVIWYIVVKLCWLELEKAEVAITGTSVVVFAALVGMVVTALLRFFASG